MGENEELKSRFAALIQEHGRSMYRSARALLPGDAQAQDAVGEAVLLAWQSFGKLRELQAAKGWLLKITVNCAYAQLRRDRRLVELETADGALADLQWDTAPSGRSVFRAEVSYGYVSFTMTGTQMEGETVLGILDSLNLSALGAYAPEN